MKVEGNKITFNRDKLIEFFDHPSVIRTAASKGTSGTVGSHASAITGLIGEDLLIGLLQHYWKSVNTNVKSSILSYECKQGKGKKGKRLDAWVQLQSNDTSSLFQVEVKNWSGHSLSAYNLSVNADTKVLCKFAQKRWDHYFPANGKGGIATEIDKVILDMDYSKVYQQTTPVVPIRKKLICFWFYIVSPNFPPSPFNEISITVNGKTHDLCVFSGSAYLRTLTQKTISVEMPRASARFHLLNSLCE